MSISASLEASRNPASAGFRFFYSYSPEKKSTTVFFIFLKSFELALPIFLNSLFVLKTLTCDKQTFPSFLFLPFPKVNFI